MDTCANCRKTAEEAQPWRGLRCRGMVRRGCGSAAAACSAGNLSGSFAVPHDQGYAVSPNRPSDLRQSFLPFADHEYHDRLEGLHEIMDLHGLDAVVLTSTDNVAYYAGFLDGAAGSPFACVVTQTDCVTISAGIATGHPFHRSIGEAIAYPDFERDGLWRAVALVTGEGKAVGCEADHLTLAQAEAFNTFLRPRRGMDIAPATLQQRLTKSPAEIALLRQAAEVADLGAQVVRDAIRVGVTEREVSIAGRDAMERAIAARFPDAEYQGSRAWLQSGPNAGGLRNPVTNRKLRQGDTLRFTCLPMLDGYGTPLERTLFLGMADAASLRVWQGAVDLLAYAGNLLTPGAICAEIAAKLDVFLAERDLLPCRTGSYGHGLDGPVSAWGRDRALDLRGDNATVLEPGMVVALAPTLVVPAASPGAGCYRQGDSFVVTEAAPERLGHFPNGPACKAEG